MTDLPDYNTTITSEAKHYAVYGFGDADGAPADVSIPTLYDIYLRPWIAYVAAGGRGAMASHNSVNGRPCHSSSWLLTDIFRNELGCEKCFIGKLAHTLKLNQGICKAVVRIGFELPCRSQ